jgi:hypothetical protein
VTTISCKSAVLFEDEAVACCAPAEPAHRQAAAALAAAKLLIEKGKSMWRRSTVRMACCIKPLAINALVLLRECLNTD